MGAPDLLHQLRDAGLVLTLTPDDRLHVAPREALTDDLRAAIRAERDALVLALNAEKLRPRSARRGGNPYMTPEEGDACHDPCWTDAEIATFLERNKRFTLMGRVDAEHLAERLTLRDRQRDDQRMCVECSELEASGHCAAAHRSGAYASRASPGTYRPEWPDELLELPGCARRAAGNMNSQIGRAHV